jgi:hypothetical protein
LWKWLSRDGDHNPVSGPIVEAMRPEIKTGNKSAEEVMESWTSGTLCAHPTWDDDQLRRNEVLWDDWWCVLCCQCKGRPFFTAHVAKSYGRDKFIVELNTRRKAPKNLYVDKKRPWYHSWCPGCHPHKDPDENLVGMKGYIKPTHQNMVAYNAVSAVPPKPSICPNLGRCCSAVQYLSAAIAVCLGEGTGGTCSDSLRRRREGR